jgi:multicomponent Na+:H+ antiporter subunit G
MSDILRDLVVVVLLWVGAAFSLLGALGVVRMPDLFTRLQSATKTCTLGVAALMLASAIHFGYLGASTRSLLVLGFVFLTAPVAAHAIVRAGYREGVPFWGPTRIIDPRAAKPENHDEGIGGA